MATVKALAKTLGIIATVYLCCRYLGEFSSKQSAMLTALAWLGFALYEGVSASQQPAKTFSPFCVSIYPNWFALLSDFTLITSEQEYDLLWETMKKPPAGEYSVFRSGIVFTVIGPPTADGWLPGLTYLGNHKDFVSKLKIFESVIPLEHEPGFRQREHPFFKHPLWANLPELFFKGGTDGYEIGLEVQSEWWEQVCKSGTVGELAKTKSEKDHACGTTRLTVAVLPFSEFGVYYRSDDYKNMERRHKERDKQLAAHGWKRKVERDHEIRDPWFRVDHKYFAVAHRDV
jgi:hypothetical protein